MGAAVRVLAAGNSPSKRAGFGGGEGCCEAAAADFRGSSSLWITARGQIRWVIQRGRDLSRFLGQPSAHSRLLGVLAGWVLKTVWEMRPLRLPELQLCCLTVLLEFSFSLSPA